MSDDPSNPPSPGDRAPSAHGKTLDYEPWPQRRQTPKPVKIMIWAAIAVHSLGIFPAAIFLWYAVTDPTNPLGDVVMSGACCIPFALLAVLSILVLMTRVGGDR